MGEIDTSGGGPQYPDVGTALMAPFSTGLDYTNTGANMAYNAVGGPGGLSPYQQVGAGMISGAAGMTPEERAAYAQWGAIPQVGGYPQVDMPGNVMMLTGPDGAGRGYQGGYGITSGGGGGAGGASVNTDTEQMQMAMKEAQRFLGGELGDSPAMREAMAAWEEMVRPTVLAGEAITGTLGGGATSEALGHSKTEALVPLLQQEQALRAGLVPQIGQLGLGASGQQLQASITNAQLAEQAAGRSMQASIEMARLAQAAEMGDQAAQLQLRGMGMTAQQANQMASLTAQQANQMSAMKSAEARGMLGANQANRQLGAGTAMGQLGSTGVGQQLAGADAMMRAGGQSGALGAGQEQVYMDIFRQALEASGMPRQVAAQQAQAQYQDFLRMMGLSQQMYLGPTGNYVAGALTPGSVTNTTSSGGGLFGS